MLHLLHRALRGLVDFNALPKALQGVFRAVQEKRTRQGNRSVRRFMKARQYYFTALAGGGAREVARRSRQIAAGSLRAENGVVFCVPRCGGPRGKSLQLALEQTHELSHFVFRA